MISEILAARRLQSKSVKRILTNEEVQYGLWLVDKMLSEGKTYVAGWAYDALRRSEREYRRRGIRIPHARKADDLIRKALGLPLTPTRAPKELVISIGGRKSDSPRPGRMKPVPRKSAS